jgi:regulation of enolase protein 1 (concanavalin A-like superfamily)
MACSPTGEGLEVTFSRIAIGGAIGRDLHADAS